MSISRYFSRVHFWILYFCVAVDGQCVVHIYYFNGLAPLKVIADVEHEKNRAFQWCSAGYVRIYFLFSALCSLGLLFFSKEP